MITYKNINLYVDFFILYIISLNKGSRCVVSSLGGGKDYKKTRHRGRCPMTCFGLCKQLIKDKKDQRNGDTGQGVGDKYHSCSGGCILNSGQDHCHW